MPIEGQDWIDKHEAARLTGYNERTLTNLAAAGKIVAERRPIKGRVHGWFFSRVALEALNNPAPPTQQ